jgi:GTP-binding protein
MHGKAGQDLVIKVPQGTVVKDATTNEVVADLVKRNQRLLVAEGGRGGRGNSVLASPTMRAPHFCEPGQSGVFRKLVLELKLLADVGIVGMPNAGKSTLLSVISAAKPKIASYPFSTLEPGLGVVRLDENKSFVAADIPGLIEGAAKGVGLGHDFLRHIERTRLLLHMVDVSSEDVVRDVQVILGELAAYGEKVASLPQILVLSKIDAADADAIEDARRRVLATFKDRFIDVLEVAAVAQKNTRQLCLKCFDELAKHPIDLDAPDLIEDDKARERPLDSFTVHRQKKLFFIEGARVEKLVAVTDLKDPMSLHHMYNALRSIGVIERLIAEGAKPGSEIVAGGITFLFGDEMA